MLFWIDAQLSPAFSRWLHQRFGVEAIHVRQLGLQTAKDKEIFDRARQANAIVITKDRDFVELVMRFGAPPQVVWVVCGNTSTARLCQIFEQVFQQVQQILAQNEPVVEVGDM